MNFAIRMVILVVVVFALYAISTYTQTSWHEAAHQRIFAEFGVNSTVQMSYLGLGDAETLANATQYSKLSQSQQDIVGALQAENEIVGYQIMGVIDTIIFVFAVSLAINLGIFKED